MFRRCAQAAASQGRPIMNNVGCELQCTGSLTWVLKTRQYVLHLLCSGSWPPQHTEHACKMECLMRAQEAVLEVEYFLAVVPPDTQQALPHDDWCACSALADWEILTPSYTAPMCQHDKVLCTAWRPFSVHGHKRLGTDGHNCHTAKRSLSCLRLAFSGSS